MSNPSVRADVFNMVYDIIPKELARRQGVYRSLNVANEYEANFSISSIRTYNRLYSEGKLYKDSEYTVDGVIFYVPTVKSISRYYETFKESLLGKYHCVYGECVCFSDRDKPLYHTPDSELNRYLSYYKALLLQEDIDDIISREYNMLIWELHTDPTTFTRLRLNLPKRGV